MSKAPTASNDPTATNDPITPNDPTATNDPKATNDPNTPNDPKAAKSLAPKTLEDLKSLLSASSQPDLDSLFTAAYDLKVKLCGRKVVLRGIVEAGNRCAKDCLYCGIRRSNSSLERYTLAIDEIVRAAEFCKRENYASMVIQSGEIESEAHTRFIEEALREIAPLNLGITLSLGEQTQSVYHRWREAGAERYLLRIETSNPQLYAQLHPEGHSWRRRVECLTTLRRLGYQTGTGVMCALPGQTLEDLARDIAFFAEIDADMIGMGPYIPHPSTPLALDPRNDDFTRSQRLTLGLKMIAATRLYLPTVNIAASTALQTLAIDGRARGVLAGANVIMPNVTETRYRRGYQLYEGKPTLNENAADARKALEAELAAIGETIDYGHRGDSAHYHARIKA